VQPQQRGTLVQSGPLVAVLLLRCSDVDSGAPDVEQLLNGTLLLEIAEWVLATMAEGADMASFEVGANKRGQFRYVIG
jgi:type VI secretion system protein VasG